MYAQNIAALEGNHFTTYRNHCNLVVLLSFESFSNGSVSFCAVFSDEKFHFMALRYFFRFFQIRMSSLMVIIFCMVIISGRSKKYLVETADSKTKGNWNNSLKVFAITEATSLDWKSQCLENPSVPLLRLADKKSRIPYIEFETLKKQCWSYLRNIKTAINYFLQTFCSKSSQISLK
jgi:hypothetical protein